jgi:hypothetical protein
VQSNSLSYFPKIEVTTVFIQLKTSPKNSRYVFRPVRFTLLQHKSQQHLDAISAETHRHRARALVPAPPARIQLFGQIPERTTRLPHSSLSRRDAGVRPRRHLHYRRDRRQSKPQRRPNQMITPLFRSTPNPCRWPRPNARRSEWRSCLSTATSTGARAPARVSRSTK